MNGNTKGFFPFKNEISICNWMNICTTAANIEGSIFWRSAFSKKNEGNIQIMMMINSSQLQSKGIFYFWIYSGRVLSIHSDPCQALTTKQTKMKNYRKWKWEIAKLVSKSQILTLAFPTISTKSKASCQAPLVFTKCGDAWNHNFDFDKNWSLPPQLLQPPGLRLPGCLPPLQLPKTGHWQAGKQVTGQSIQTNLKTPDPLKTTLKTQQIMFLN